MRLEAEYTALTVFQPWATLIIEGWKPYEFRGWPPPVYLIDYQLAIHAAARPVKREELAGLLFKLQKGGEQARATGLIEHDKVIPFLERLMAAPQSVPRSTVLGICTVGTPLRDRDMFEALGLPMPDANTLGLLPASPVNDSDRDEHSNWGWPLKVEARCRPLMPVTGKQGLWPWRPSFGVALY